MMHHLIVQRGLLPAHMPQLDQLEGRRPICAGVAVAGVKGAFFPVEEMYEGEGGGSLGLEAAEHGMGNWC